MRLGTRLCGLLATLFPSFGWRFQAWKPVPVVAPVRLSGRCGSHRGVRRGLTLVEMMISVTLTLIVVFALVQVFQLLGNSVTDSRGIIEMSGNLRTAADLLRQDLEGLTVTTLPPRDPAQGEGYLEIVDGPVTDRSQYRVMADGTVQLNDLGVPGTAADANADGFLDASLVDTSVGDVDDILAFTTRREGQPYTGMVSHAGILVVNRNVKVPLVDAISTTRTITSSEAEIVWWLQVEQNVEGDATKLAGMDVSQQLANAVTATSLVGNGGRLNFAQKYASGTPVRSLRRRVLLVRPDLDLSAVRLNGLDAVAAFASNNDISVRFVRQPGGSEVYGVEANSLGDLTQRHNRSFRAIFRATDPLASNRFGLTRISDDRDVNRILLSESSLLMRHAAMKDMYLSGDDGSTGTFMMRRGQDVVLGDVLSFDVQVWDPEAPVMMGADGSTPVTPSDPGFTSATGIAGQGAYVDLGFGVKPKGSLPTPLLGQFGGLPHRKSRLPIVGADNDSADVASSGFGSATYCTWNEEYEHDGYNQNPTDGALVDEGTNGFDDDNRNGVDDPGEAETSPPYPYPLRGINIRLRVMDFTTRQVRQSSVTTDFLPE